MHVFILGISCTGMGCSPARSLHHRHMLGAFASFLASLSEVFVCMVKLPTNCKLSLLKKINMIQPERELAAGPKEVGVELHRSEEKVILRVVC